MTHPPLSSIAFNSEDAGYKAAKLLDEMMAGKTKMKNQEILVEPKYVVTRQSTNIFTVKDPEIAKAIRFIYENAQNPIQVADVIAATSLSRSSLFKRFSKLAGHSMHSQIRRVRTRYIIQMLLDTDMPLANLAHKLGFSTGSHMARFFKKERGMSPTQFRKKYRQK
jgi:LacI family transcriptional regulator